MVRNGGLGGLYTPPAPSERIIPTRNGTVPPPQGRGGTWYASTGNVRHVRCGGEDGSSAPKHLGVPMVSSPLAGGATVIMYIISVALPVPKILVRRSCMRCWFFLPASVFLLLVIFSGT